jgi:hypothetical protein
MKFSQASWLAPPSPAPPPSLVFSPADSEAAPLLPTLARTPHTVTGEADSPMPELADQRKPPWPGDAGLGQPCPHQAGESCPVLAHLPFLKCPFHKGGDMRTPRKSPEVPEAYPRETHLSVGQPDLGVNQLSHVTLGSHSHMTLGTWDTTTRGLHR